MKVISVRFGGQMGYGEGVYAPEEPVVINGRHPGIITGDTLLVRRRSIIGDRFTGIEGRWTHWMRFTITAEKDGVLYLDRCSGLWGKFVPLGKLKGWAQP